MNREEFYREYPEFNHTGSPTSIMEKIVADDFKNRTCKNCKWDRTSEYIHACALIGYSRYDDFGCNKFEAKTVSTDSKGE